MILVTLLAWLASMFLSAVLSRQVNAKQAIKSTEIRSTMNAAAARITSCLSAARFPANNTCAAPTGTDLVTFTDCTGGGSFNEFNVGDAPNQRPVNFVICAAPANPPCRFRINVCEPTETCPAPTCP